MSADDLHKELEDDRAAEAAKRRAYLLDRSRRTVKNPVYMLINTSGRAVRQMITELNKSIGMNAYEIISTDPTPDGQVKMEFIVPEELALMLKLRWNGL